METIDVSYSSGQYSSVSRRLGAALLDGLILLIPGVILANMIPLLGGVIVWFFYVPFFESSVLKATPGKKLMGIQVVDVHGGRISFRTAMVRSLVKLVSYAISCLPFLTIFFTEKKQALHDLVAETAVVYGRAEIPVMDAWVDEVKEVFRGGSAAFQNGTAGGDRLGALERLQALYERGALSKEEFEQEKKKLLEL